MSANWRPSCRRSLKSTIGRRLVGLALLTVAPVTGCVSPPRFPVIAQRFRLEVHLDPASHSLVGRTVMDLVSADVKGFAPDQPVAIELLLHPDLKITHVETSGATRKRPRLIHPLGSPGGSLAKRYLVVLDRPVDALTLFVTYRGRLFQDISAGEKPGEIHNFAVNAHIGGEGIFLGDSYWYPRPAPVERLGTTTAEYLVLVDPVPGMLLRAAADRDLALGRETSPRTNVSKVGQTGVGAGAWRSTYPIDGMVLVGGPQRKAELVYDGITIIAQLQANDMKYADGLMEAVRRSLERYQPLIGPYPSNEFAVVENFFSSGFAFPTFTLLSSSVIRMGRRSQTTHGYLDHEILHSWWGNGIQVDPRDGNWCEALASYGANYYGYVLDGRDEEARRKRRNYSHFLSRLKAEDDKPLGTYGLTGGCGRGIAYNKGAMVFHMLARKIGQDNFWSAMRRLTAEYVGRQASWEDIRRLCEQVSGIKLETFMRQWVRRGGAPKLRMERAVYDSGDHTLSLDIAQGQPAFELEVPVRVTHADGEIDLVVSLKSPRETVTVPLDVVPWAVEIDPDYHIFRKVALDDIIPTTATTRRSKEMVIVFPKGPAADRYQQIAAIFTPEDEDTKRPVRTAGDLETGALAERSVLILGAAARDPYVSGFLQAVGFPVQFDEDGFTFDAVRYDNEEDAVLATIVHPGLSGGGVTVIAANRDSAIPNPINIPMYDRSLVIFRKGRPILRRDFERRHRLEIGY